MKNVLRMEITTEEDTTPPRAVSAAKESSVNKMPVATPVTVHAISGEDTRAISKKNSSTASQKLPQTGNQHQSVW